MKNTFVILFLFLSFFVLNSYAQACNNFQKTVLRNLELQAVETIDSWLYNLKNHYKVDIEGIKNPSHHDEYQTRSPKEMATQIIMCSQDLLKKGFDYKCTDLEEYTARTLPIVGREVEISNSRFWPLRDSFRVGVVIHEATHKCGTNDGIYFSSKERPRNHWLYGWATIASTYDNWVVNGICIPGTDCN